MRELVLETVAPYPSDLLWEPLHNAVLMMSRGDNGLVRLAALMTVERCYQANFSGKAGERFCAVNAGVKTFVKGVGDHGCDFDEDQAKCSMRMIIIGLLTEWASDASIEDVEGCHHRARVTYVVGSGVEGIWAASVHKFMRVMRTGVVRDTTKIGCLTHMIT
ncbi:hypothetical protein PInf_025139 [Phytophthora infestans]|nr:hypothetical protein PInf_025139 [Phytophthora infestans]